MRDAAAPFRLAVIGAGFMARRRARAFLATGRVEICGVAARRLETALALGAELNCTACFDDHRRLAECTPDAVLVEVPHQIQDEMTGWAIAQGVAVLIGGPLSRSVAGGEAILRAAQAKGLVVEAGYEARYKKAWETARDWIGEGRIGRPVAVRSVALWDGRPDSWYYREEESGGMPLTHMTYTFINPLRWLFGEPLQVSAFANRLKHTAPGLVREETCVANLLFPRDVLCTMTAGFVKPDESRSWDISVIGTEGSLEICPTEMDNGHLVLRRGSEVVTLDLRDAPEAFGVQAEAFLDSIKGGNRCRNRPEDTLGDLRVAAAITMSAQELRMIAL